MSISLLQFLTACFWFVTALLCAPATYRIFFSKIKFGDIFRSVLFFTAMIFVGHSGRWLLFPESILTFKLLYGMAITLAVYTWVVLWNLRRDRRERY